MRKRDLNFWLIRIVRLKKRVARLMKEALKRYPEHYGALSMHHSMFEELEQNIRELIKEENQPKQLEIKFPGKGQRL